MGYNVHLTPKSKNAKTGPIPVSTSTADTCPETCPFNHGNEGGCYAAVGPLAIHWRRVTEGKRGTDWESFCETVEAFEPGQLWRHNQAGDLPGDGDRIDKTALARLVVANEGKRGFTYTHYDPAPENLEVIRISNAQGFTVNLSGNNLEHADELADTGAGPVVAVLPSTVHGPEKIYTPKGRRVVVCPATYRDDISCATCGLCQQKEGRAIVGFPAHGSAKKRADRIAAISQHPSRKAA